MKTFDYFAVIHPDSKYIGQKEFKPFKVKLDPSIDGYHWRSDMGDRYRDHDLVLLYQYPNEDWFAPILNREFIKPPFQAIHISGRIKGEKKKARPSKLIRGQKVLVSSKFGEPYEAVFIERTPRHQGQPAKNYFSCDYFTGLNGPDDTGSVTMSDYEVSNLCSLVI